MRPEPRSADPLSENLRHPGQAPDGTVVLHRPTPFLSSDSTAADYDAWPLGSPPQAANRSRHHPAALAIRPNRWARNDAGANAGRPHPPGRLRAQAPSFSAASQTGRVLSLSERRVGMVPLCGQPLTGAMDSAKKKTRSQCFLPGPATDVWIQTCRTSHPYGTAWNLFLSLGEPPFVRDWARAAFSYPSLPS